MAFVSSRKTHATSNSTITMEATLRNLSLFATVTGGLLALLVHSSAANAQATRTWVSGVGDDVNPCSRTAPCKTFAGAISKTAQNGEINCLDPAGYGAVTITKSMTINCFYTDGSILNSGTTGIIINITNAADPLKTVRLVGININGSGAGTRSGINGINILAADNVFIENVLVTDQTQVGIRDARTVANNRLVVSNTTVRNNASAGIQLIATNGTDVVLDRVSTLFNTNGIAVGSGNRVMIKSSVSSGNTVNGLSSDPGGNVSINGSVFSNNSANGINAVAGASVRIGDNDITLNSTGINGATTSYGTNRLLGNTSGVGTTPTLNGADTNAHSQQ